MYLLQDLRAKRIRVLSPQDIQRPQYRDARPKQVGKLTVETREHAQLEFLLAAGQDRLGRLASLAHQDGIERLLIERAQGRLMALSRQHAGDGLTPGGF